MKTVDTCTFCAKKKLCMPTKPYHGFCQWRETEQTKGQTIERDAGGNYENHLHSRSFRTGIEILNTGRR